ncbi:MAG TPA: hypothetical protein VFG59_15295 [Anaeromyxobacter sp.]|nr:hypothetical protein [Anaeromyxobacter sp.]
MARPPRPEEQETVLSAALARVRAAAPGGVVVFDLDSTLLDNRPRLARVLEDYGRMAGLPELLGARPEHWRGWSLEAALRNAGLPAELVEEHVGPARRFFADWFLTNAYCRLDTVVPGAPAYVRSMAEAGAVLAYVSGRPRGMVEGTRSSLCGHGFPPDDGRSAHLFLKPVRELSDDAWKLQAIPLVERLGPVLAVFDNEPTHVNAYARAWPEALAVHLDTDHSGRPVEVLPAIPSVLDFTRVVRDSTRR